MMKGRKYGYRDFRAISQWYEARSLTVPPHDALPKEGIIVPGVAAGFLMQTDTSSCILEPFIANPKASIGLRNEALNLILHQLTERAKQLGYDRAFGFASSETMIKRSLDQGFRAIELCTTVCKELE